MKAREFLLREGLVTLERQAGEQVSDRAAKASEGLAMLDMFIFNGSSRSRRLSRRALEIDPGRWRALELLTGLLAGGLFGGRGQWRDLADLYERLNARRETSRNCLRLAIARVELGDLERAQAAARRAIELDLKSFQANLALAVVRIKRTRDVSLAWDVPPLIEAAYDLLAKPAPQDQFVEFGLVISVWGALTGNVDAAEAGLRKVLEVDPGNKTATEILAAIGR